MKTKRRGAEDAGTRGEEVWQLGGRVGESEELQGGYVQNMA